MDGRHQQVERPAFNFNFVLLHTRFKDVAFFQLFRVSLERRFTLPGRVDVANVAASLVDGKLTLSLLEAKDSDDVVECLLQGLRDDFDVHCTSLLIYGESAQVYASHDVRMVPLSEAKKYLPELIDNCDSVCGNLSMDQQKFVFAERASSIHSTAMISFNYGSPIGLLAIGHSDKDYFNADMDTLFLRYIGDVLARLLR